MNEFIGVIFAALNAISLYFLTQYKDIWDSIFEAKNSILGEFENRQKEFARILTSQNVEETMLNLVVESIKRIHFAAHRDSHYLGRQGFYVNALFPFFIIFVITAVFSIILGLNMKNGQEIFGLTRIQYLNIPPMVFIVQVVFILLLVNIRKSVSQLKDKYRTREY
ncbi:hypothetical protein ACFL37_02205 [Candidatus Margulisiibacteriota bacterium]